MKPYLRGTRVVSLSPPPLTEPKNVRVRGTVDSGWVPAPSTAFDAGYADGCVGVRFDGILHEIFMPVTSLRRLDLVEQLGELAQ